MLHICLVVLKVLWLLRRQTEQRHHLNCMIVLKFQVSSHLPLNTLLRSGLMHSSCSVCHHALVTFLSWQYIWSQVHG